MDKAEAVERLQLLIDEIDEFEFASLDLPVAEAELEDAKNRHFSYLADFDKQHKAAFIKERAGNKPKRPNLATILIVPVYRSQKARYKEENAEYKKRLSDAEEAYKKHYSDERKKLKEQDASERAIAIRDAENALSTARNAYTIAKDNLDNDGLLSTKMKTRAVACKLLEFFEDGRVDTLKEAINLWFDEKRKDEEEARVEAYRQEMKKLEEERVRAAQSAEEYASMQYFEVADAADYARQAAENAGEIADQAHQREWDDMMEGLEYQPKYISSNKQLKRRAERGTNESHFNPSMCCAGFLIPE